MTLWHKFQTPRLQTPPALMQGARVLISAPRLRDYPHWQALRDQSASLLKHREPLWDADALSRSEFRRYVRAYQRGARLGLAYAFFIWNRADSQFLGACHLTHIRRGAAQMGTLGYWLGTAFHGQGYMREAVGLICDYAYARLGLHRLEAACMPDNHASKHLLLKNGFLEEGYAARYLKINGRWEDHLLFGRSRESEA